MTELEFLPHQNKIPKGTMSRFWQGKTELTKVRTLAKKTLKINLPFPDEISRFGDGLMDKKHADLFPSNGILHLGFESDPSTSSSSERHALTARTLFSSAASLFGSEIYDIGFAVCAEQSYHDDSTLTEDNAYVAWVVETSSPLSFHTMGMSTPLIPGDMIVFDARLPHALIRSCSSAYLPNFSKSKDHKLVFALGVLPFTPKLRKAMGITLKPVPLQGDIKKTLRYSESTGQFLDDPAEEEGV